jgi:hypothetical protein
MGFVPVQAPLVHANDVAHRLAPPEQAVPSGAVGFEHVPVVTSHVPAAWHWSLGAQTTGLEPVHVPPVHVYV